VVAYRRHRRVRVAAGAPVCAAERLPAVAAAFEREARAAGQRVCWFGAERRLEALYAGAPDHALVLLGAQPVWDPRAWPDVVRGHASLRAQLNRARNKGTTAVEWPRERAHGHPALRRLLAEWLATRGLPPLHFLVEPETLERLFDRRVFVAERAGAVAGAEAGADGTHPVAFLVASPVPRRDGWLIEQFVRGHAAPNGTIELLVDAAMRALAADGAVYVTLGLAPLSARAGRFDPVDPPWLRLVLLWVRAHGRRFYNFEGLETFKAKLRPAAWEPVFAIVDRPRFVPGDLWAIAGVFGAGSPVLLVLRATLRAALTELRWLGRRLRRGLARPASRRSPS
jgi:phosphatidylglycerol lysyltransferase